MKALGTRVALAWFVFASLAGCGRPASPASSAAPEHAAAAGPRYIAPDEDGWGKAGELSFLELITRGGERSQELPMILLLHGMGDQPNPGWLNGFDVGVPVRVIMPRAPIPHYQGFSWFTYDVGGNNPPAQLAQGISQAAAQLSELLALVPAKRPTRGLPIVAGFSQGGILSYALALREPERLRFAVPIAGLLPEPLWPTQKAPARQTPIRGLHGANDVVVPVTTARALSQRLRELGYDAQLEEFAGIGHNISAKMQDRVNALLREAIER